MAAPILVGLPRPPLHFSQLKAMSLSPMHYEHALRVGREETRALRLGIALDAGAFGTREVIIYKGERRGDKWKQFEAQNGGPGRVIITHKEEPIVEGMARSLLSRPDALELLRGERQKTLNWTINGRECEGTPDAFTAERITDLKTSRTAHPERFPYEARRYGYVAQLSWYVGAIVATGRPRPKDAFIVVVETLPPHPVTIFQVTERALELGERTWRLWFERLRACEESNAWPPYTEAFVPLDAPEDSEGFSLTIGGEDVEVE